MATIIDHIGKYELRSVLARTPMSTVYDGWDSAIARRVAVKLIPMSAIDDAEAGEAYARFKRGAQAAGQLNHPNIVGVYDYGETADYAYLVMEFVDGPSLKGKFDNNQRFAKTEICKIIGSMLEALQYSHDRGVVHRDVKPANIMFTKDNSLKITDFGIARLENSDMTQSGMVIGTPAYMSPEQFLGEKIDLRTDIYSTGVVLYQMVTGERPYEGNLATIMHKVLYGTPLLPSRVSRLATPALDDVVTRAMARKREDRFRSAAEFNAALQAAGQSTSQPLRPQQTEPSRASRVPLAQPGTLSASSQTVRVSVLAAAVLLAIGAAGWYFLAAGNRQPVREALAPPAPPPAVHAVPEPAPPAPPTQPPTQAPSALAEAPASSLPDASQSDPVPAAEPVAPPALMAPPQDVLEPPQPPTIAPIAKPSTYNPKTSPPRVPPGRFATNDPTAGKPDASDTKLKMANVDNNVDSALRRLRQGRTEPPSPPPQELSVPLPSYPVTSSSAVGLLCQSVTKETADKLGLEAPQGMVVTGVVVGSPADRAGIRENDVILKIGGTEAHQLSVLAKVAAGTPPGQTVPLDVYRQGHRRVVQLAVDDLRH
jgi:serine/threonine protein kinase